MAKKEERRCVECGKKITFWNRSNLMDDQGKCSFCLFKQPSISNTLNTSKIEKTDERTAAEKVNDLGDSFGRVAKAMLPTSILIIIGFFTLPLGIILWIIGLGIFVGSFSKKK